MKTNILRKISMAIPSLMVSSMAFAAMDMDSRVTELENKMTHIRTETATGRYGAKTAAARAEVDGEGLFILADILYWQTRVGGTEFAYTDQDPTASLPIRGRTKDMDFDWDWGLRIGLGYNFVHDNWDIRAVYTWFDTNGSNSTRSGVNSSIIPLRGSSNITSDPTNPAIPPVPQFLYCTSAKSQYDFNYDAVDLELGRAYYISGKLSFRPHWGMKAAWMNQEQIIRYTGGSPDAAVNPTVVGLSGNTVHIDDECDFWGIGPRVGFDTKWYLGYGFSIFGNLNGALLFGYFDVEHEEKYSGFINNKIKLDANRHAFSPTAQMQLGLRYDTYINNNKQHLGIGLGFEVEYWWRQNQMLQIDETNIVTASTYERYSEDVSMHGVTLNFQWDF
jgi:hypothetical protein